MPIMSSGGRYNMLARKMVARFDISKRTDARLRQHAQRTTDAQQAHSSASDRHHSSRYFKKGGMGLRRERQFIRERLVSQWPCRCQSAFSNNSNGTNCRGRVVRDKASGQQKLMCRNWECGVVVPARTASEPNSPIDMNIFKGTISIPMQVPGRRYSQQEHPWFFQKT